MKDLDKKEHVILTTDDKLTASKIYKDVLFLSKGERRQLPHHRRAARERSSAALHRIVFERRGFDDGQVYGRENGGFC